MLLPTDELARQFTYDPDSGLLVWRERVIRPESVSQDKNWNIRFAGKEAGGVTPYGYRSVTVTLPSGKMARMLVHRVAWSMYYGAPPELHIDHINGIGTDNRIANLRLATVVQNMGNLKLRKDNTSGYRGVSFIPRLSLWRARIHVGGKQAFYQSFRTKEEAIAAHREASARIRGHFCPILSRDRAGTEES